MRITLALWYGRVDQRDFLVRELAAAQRGELRRSLCGFRVRSFSNNNGGLDERVGRKLVRESCRSHFESLPAPPRERGVEAHANH